MQVEILYVEGCPNAEPAARQARAALDQLGTTGMTVDMRLIAKDDAESLPFGGSPTVLVDGEDAVPGAARTADLACRIYRDPTGVRGYPTAEQLIPAIRAKMPECPLD